MYEIELQVDNGVWNRLPRRCADATEAIAVATKVMESMPLERIAIRFVNVKDTK